MKCVTHQFGEIDYAEEHVYYFPEGIIGFEQLRKFIIINDADTEPFRWLVSIEDENFCVPILDPTFVEPHYEGAGLFEVGATVAVIASLKEPIEQSTVNLRSPLVFDVGNHVGKQTILETDRFAIQHRFIDELQLVAGV